MSARRYIPIPIKRAIWNDACEVCFDCGDIEVDHIIAIADGGDSRPSNLQPLCRVCNMLKVRLRTTEAVRAWRNEHPEEFERLKSRREQRINCVWTAA